MKDVGDNKDRVLEVLVVVTPLFAVDGNGNSNERGRGGDTVYSARDERGRRLENPAPLPPPVVVDERGTTRSRKQKNSRSSSSTSASTAPPTYHPPIQNVPACGSFQVRAFNQPPH